MAAPARPELDELLKLDVATRLEIIRVLWNSVLDAGEPPSLTESERTELDRRLAEYEQDPDEGSSWDDVKARLPR